MSNQGDTLTFPAGPLLSEDGGSGHPLGEIIEILSVLFVVLGLVLVVVLLIGAL